MNRNTKILLLVVIVLTGAYALVKFKPWRTSPKSSGSFSVEDTSVVTKIFMANKMGQKVLLERAPGNQWMVNGKFPADETKVKLLLSTLHDMQIQTPVAPSMHNTAIAILASRGIKTEIYAGDDLIKTIYVGSETPDKTGTFMILEDEDQPYIIHIPGFVGFLTPRFFLTEIKWRSKLVFDLQPEDISAIQIDYLKSPKESFTYYRELFKQTGNILDNQGNTAPADSQAIKFMIHSFSQKYVEGYYDDSVFTAHERDSLFRLTPYCRIMVKHSGGKQQNVVLYEKPVGARTKERYDEKGRELSIDPEKFYAKIDDIEQIASIQEYAFRGILAKGSKLLLPPKAEDKNVQIKN